MAIVLITGGNKGLGYETARRLIALGHKVWIGCRDEERGLQAANQLKAQYIHLDVMDSQLVEQASHQIEEVEGHLDILINNAGISGIKKKVADITAEDMEKVFNTNVFGIVRVTNAFIPLLRKSDNPVIVNVSSGLGSFGMTTDPARMESKINSLTYSSAKAAVSMLTLQYAKGLPEMRVNCVDPGSTATDLNGGRGQQTVAEGSEIIVKMALISKEAETGTFVSQNGIVPW